MQGPHTTDSLVENCHLELTQIIKKKKTLELFLPSSPPAALHSYTCKLTQGNSTYALPRGKRKIQELQLCHFPTEVKTKKPSSNFTWPQRSKGTQTRGKHISCPQHTVQSYIKDLSGYFPPPLSSLDCACSNTVKAPSEPSHAYLTLPAKVRRSARAKPKRLDTLEDSCVCSLYKRGRKGKVKHSWSNLPSSQLEHYQGWDAVAILRYGEADNVQLSTLSSGQYFKYLHSHVLFWGVANMTTF